MACHPGQENTIYMYLVIWVTGQADKQLGLVIGDNFELVGASARRHKEPPQPPHEVVLLAETMLGWGTGLQDRHGKVVRGTGVPIKIVQPFQR